MLIESLIRRKMGTQVDMLGIRYHFQPLDSTDAESAHVCEVGNKRAIQRFLAITEGFCIAGAEPVIEQIPSPPTPVTTSSSQPEITTEMVDDDATASETEIDDPAPPPAYLLTTLDLTVGKIKTQLKGMGQDDLKMLRELEINNANRKSVLKAIDQRIT